MKKLAVMTAGLVVILAAISVAAQMTPPTPAPELKKLDYFIGTWNIDATIGPGPWGGGGKFTATGTDEWLKGNFFVVGHDDFSLPAELGGLGGKRKTDVFGLDGTSLDGARLPAALVPFDGAGLVSGRLQRGKNPPQGRVFSSLCSPVSWADCL